ncbi:hypothetical protein JL722_13868 [Aureococcus anophagefferens]|nr:hypothetical protein JL722_13868 [Aureococcus anophagefferens]
MLAAVEGEMTEVALLKSQVAALERVVELQETAMAAGAAKHFGARGDAASYEAVLSRCEVFASLVRGSAASHAPARWRARAPRSAPPRARRRREQGPGLEAALARETLRADGAAKALAAAAADGDARR